MEFTVTFTTNDRNLPLVEKLGSAGADLLDLIRETHPLARDIVANKVWFDNSCPIVGHCRTMPLNEEQARSSSLFKGRTEVRVVVPAASFTKFVDLDFEDRYVSISEKQYLRPELAKIPFLRWMAGRHVVLTQKLAAVRVSYLFSEEEALNKWIAAGYPLVWKP